jgi:hypothetical protein
VVQPSVLVAEEIQVFVEAERVNNPSREGGSKEL